MNKDKDDIIRIIKSPDNLRALIEGTSETVKHEIKGQEGGFLAMLLGILDYSMLENMKNWKEVMKSGKGVERAGALIICIII